MSDDIHEGSVGIVIDRQGNVREMGWSEDTLCKVHHAYMAGPHAMCPRRDNVCEYCCHWCDLKGNCEFPGPRDSVEDASDSTK